MPLPDQIARLRLARNRLVAQKGWTHGFATKIDDVAVQVVELLGQAAGHEGISASLASVRSTLDALRAVVTDAIALLDQSIAHHSMPHSTPRSATPPGRDSNTRANRHGDRYPAEAVPYDDALPPRVRRGKRDSPPMTGFVMLDGRDAGEITATRTDIWTDEARAGLVDLGLLRAKGLSNHVEMKAVIMMIRTGATDGRIVINHAPCGSEPGDPTGCSDVLPTFLPEGRRLTVLGTDVRGAPFKRTYHGRASR
ncbi:hypothetical protein JOD54_006395 [Actinokineospora baliensis]|uniref:DddA-like double-stranded DNA deaminase toxin n=1 Tax=Actinokineospora baliensis TaxID=547056 RepID=UPI0019596D44|nr:DddA-like double-stranded DNA deaminase toxin [Actinokineospora baliensis]MBM7776191.1 hypothetical protein [Actinokineospora baliensis]